MLIAEITAFTAALIAIFWVRRRQVWSLQQQQFYLRRFAEGVTAWRGKIGIPQDARQAVEVLVNMPIDKRITRACARSMLQEQGDPDLTRNGFWIARSQLNDEERGAFDWLLANYFLAMTYSDWLTGWFIRRVRVSGLSRETQAEIAIETVFARHGMMPAVAAAAA